MHYRAPLAMIATAVLLVVTACSKSESIEGRYNLTKGPAQGVVATFGKSTFALSTGASGTYEISKGHAILSGATFAGDYKIDGDKLIGPGDQWEFVRRADSDTSPINTGGFSGTKMPTIGGKGY